MKLQDVLMIHEYVDNSLQYMLVYLQPNGLPALWNCTSGKAGELCSKVFWKNLCLVFQSLGSTSLLLRKTSQLCCDLLWCSAVATTVRQRLHRRGPQSSFPNERREVEEHLEAALQHSPPR